MEELDVSPIKKDALAATAWWLWKFMSSLTWGVSPEVL